MAKGLIKILIVAWVAYLTLKSALPGFIPLMDTNVAAILAAISKTAMKLAFRIALAILILGILDFQFQKWQHLKQLKMTKQEVKDEWKQIEGDPHLKSHIRRIQMKLSMNRMIKKVPTADVVIANPVHLAVALKYDPESMSAPTVIAKGKRKMAEKIKAIAREHDIPVVEDPLLARALYKSADVGMQVPYDLYQAVAEVLAMVYRLREAA
jgi:flagellar biosynthetic protein FlhB